MHNERTRARIAAELQLLAETYRSTPANDDRQSLAKRAEQLEAFAATILASSRSGTPSIIANAA